MNCLVRACPFWCRAPPTLPRQACMLGTRLLMWAFLTLRKVCATLQSPIVWASWHAATDECPWTCCGHGKQEAVCYETKHARAAASCIRWGPVQDSRVIQQREAQAEADRLAPEAQAQAEGCEQLTQHSKPGQGPKEGGGKEACSKESS